MSDSHDNWPKLEKAIELANKENCEHLFFAGDLISPTGIPVLAKFNGQVHIVWGNNEGEKMGFINKVSQNENIKLYGDICEIELQGRKIFMNHYPRISELAAKSGEFDLCIFGHTHDLTDNVINGCRLINPGSVAEFIIIFELDTMLSKNIKFQDN